MRKRKNKLDEHAQLEAARIIAAEPLKYPGVMQTWAKLFLQKHSDTGNAIEYRLGAWGKGPDAIPH